MEIKREVNEILQRRSESRVSKGAITDVQMLRGFVCCQGLPPFGNLASG